MKKTLSIIFLIIIVTVPLFIIIGTLKHDTSVAADAVTEKCHADYPVNDLSLELDTLSNFSIRGLPLDLIYAIATNHTDNLYLYHWDFKLYRYCAGAWSEIEPILSGIFFHPPFRIEPHSSARLHFSLHPYLFGYLDRGIYKITMTAHEYNRSHEVSLDLIFYLPSLTAHSVESH